MQDIDELLKYLVCPVTKSKLIYNQEKQELISLEAKLAYPIIDNIPVMLANKARALSKDEF